MKNTICESVEAYHSLGVRPLCRCCGGGELRKRQGAYKHTKSKSRDKNIKARKGKARHKDHRQLL